jgi:NAD(P)-dependent dehydrogenase (short-subunit alcohol dehydrogenase family)
MRILLVGATGTIGRAVATALRGRHDVIEASRHKARYHVDIADPDSIRSLYEDVGHVDAVVCAAGQAAWKPLAELTDADFAFSLRSKLMGQVNLVRVGVNWIRDGGSFTLTSGILAQQPSPGGAAASVVNAGVEAFARAAALELPRGLRINVVSPLWVSETLQAMGRDAAGGVPAADVARSYVESVEGTQTGVVIATARRSARQVAATDIQPA